VSTAKDSPEVMEFMALFHKLRDRIHDDPKGLEELAAHDPELRDLAQISNLPRSLCGWGNSFDGPCSRHLLTRSSYHPGAIMRGVSSSKSWARSCQVTMTGLVPTLSR
jgi:hypothetical protein